MGNRPTLRDKSVAVVPAPPAAMDDGHAKQMTILEHLNELRQRLVWAFLGLAVGFVFGMFLAQPALEFIRDPYCRVAQAADDCRLVVLGPTSGVVTYFRMALMLGAVIAIPLVVYQGLMFIVPGLTRKEKRVVVGFLPAITLFFIGGVGFAWYVLIPPALGFLEGFQPTLFKPEWTAQLYLNFVLSLLFWMGVAFQTPLIFFLLSLLGLVTSGNLVRNWRMAIVGSAMAAALITPTVDPVNMALVMGPLLVLYVFSIGLVALGGRMQL